MSTTPPCEYLLHSMLNCWEDQLGPCKIFDYYNYQILLRWNHHQLRSSPRKAPGVLPGWPRGAGADIRTAGSDMSPATGKRSGNMIKQTCMCALDVKQFEGFGTHLILRNRADGEGVDLNLLLNPPSSAHNTYGSAHLPLVWLSQDLKTGKTL